MELRHHPIPSKSATSAWIETDLSLSALHGTLTLPAGDKPVPVILMLAGSGPVDRDGNLAGMPNNSLRLLAQGLAVQGIATLRTDKRGVGASRGAGMDENLLRFDTYVRDAVAWAKLLSQQPRVTGITWLGHSEGALVATLAAQHIALSGLILVAGAGEPAARLIARQLAAARVPSDLQASSKNIAGELEQGRTVTDVPSSLDALYRPSVQPYLMSWLPLDPAGELAKVTCPVLILQGTTDLQVSVADARRLHTALPQSRLRIIEGMNHVLKAAPADRADNFQTYADPMRPVVPALIESIAQFIHASPEKAWAQTCVSR